MVVTKAWRASGWRAMALACLALAGCQKAPVKPQAEQPAPLTGDAAIDPSLQAMFAESGAPGMVVAVVRGDAVTLRGFGRMSPTDPRTPDGRTVVRLQSLSKLFSSEVLASMAADGRLKLTDPLQAYAPPGAVVAASSKGARPIELVDLATHTSGLGRNSPADPTMAPALAQAARWAWLKGRRLPPPGLHAHYSNLGFDLLGDAIAAADKRPYVDALKARVTGPLAMDDTAARLTADQCARLLAPGALTGETPCQDTTEAAASGGVYSTAADMALWIKHQLPAGAPDTTLRISQAIYVDPKTLASQQGLDVAGQPAGIGLAWIQLAPTPTHPVLLEKTGGGGGFMTYLVIAPGARVGVFVAIDKMGFKQIQALSARANDLVGALVAAPAG